MYIYSITFSIDNSIENEWLNYLKTSYIEEFLEKGNFEGHRLTKVVDSEHAENTFNLQLRCTNTEELNTFLKLEGKTIHENLVSRYNGKIAIFSTLLKLIN